MRQVKWAMGWLMVLAGAVYAESGQAGLKPGTPFPTGELSSKFLSTERPSLFLNAKEVVRARDRGMRDDRCKAVCDRLLKEADKALAIEVKPLDQSWWEAAKNKPWSDTYPEVFENTMLKPNAYAKPAADLAKAWLLTAQDKYADKAAELLRVLADYPFTAEHYDVGMNYSIWGMHVLEAYDALMLRLPPPDRFAIDGFMTRLAAAVAKNDALWIANGIGGGINNHLAWHKLTLGLLGLYYGRPNLEEHCLFGPRGMVSLLEDGLLDDGLWCESSLVYQFAAIGPMLIMADCQKRMGLRPELHELVLANGRTLKQSYDAMFDVLAPNGMIPPVGDAYGSRATLWANPMYEYAWELWEDPKYGWAIGQNPEPSDRYLFMPPPPERAAAPPTRSRLFPEHGYAFLRSQSDEHYWSGDAWCAFLTYDRSNVHANADKLSLMLFDQDRMVLSDVEGKASVPHAFSSRIQRELNRGGLSQNTVMIDGKDQVCGPRRLRLVEYHDVADEKRVTAADEEGLLYPGVRQMRTVAMTSDYVLDVFQVQAGAERQIDWIAHVLSAKATMPAEANPAVAKCSPFKLPGDGAWQWLRDARSFTPDGTIRLEWREEKSRVRLCMLPTGVERVILCGFPSSDEPGSGSVPMMMVRQRGAQAVFAAVWLIGDKVKSVELSRLADREGRLAFEVKSDKRVQRHLVPMLTGAK